MRSFVVRVLILAGVACCHTSLWAQEQSNEQPKPKFTIGKETTYVLGPLDQDGYIDYAAALNERLKQGVTPANNAAVLLWKAIGPRPEGTPMPAEFYKWLGIEEPPERGEYFIGIESYIKDRLKIEDSDKEREIRDQITRATERPWSGKDLPHVAGWLEANERPMKLIVEATKLTQYFSPMVPEKVGKGPAWLLTARLSGVQKCRELTNALAGARHAAGERRPPRRRVARSPGLPSAGATSRRARP